MRRIAYSVAIREAIEEEMRRDSSVFLLGEDIAEHGGCFGVTRSLVERFGRDRVRNTPISENGMVGIALGAALLGMRPVAEIMFMDFITLAMDQLVNHAAKFHYVYGGGIRVPMVLRTPAGAGRGYGATHSQSFESWLLSVPGLKVVAPAYPRDAKGLLKSAIREDNPVVQIENKVLYGFIDEVPDEEELIPIGKARVVHRGRDITLIAHSRMVHEAAGAAHVLGTLGISAEVIDLRTLYPLDMDALLESVRKTRRALLIEEGVQRWGVTSEISCRLTEACFDCLAGPIQRIGFPDIPVPCGYELEQMVLPTASTIVSKACDMVHVAHAARVESSHPNRRSATPDNEATT
jgi:pyruvate dehydrogenase E1 component beta subunit